MHMTQSIPESKSSSARHQFHNKGAAMISLVSFLYVGSICVDPIEAFTSPLSASTSSSVIRIQPLIGTRIRKVDLNQNESPLTAYHAMSRNMTMDAPATTTLATRTLKKRSKTTTRKKKTSATDGSKFITDAMLNHELLTKEEENILGNKLLRARSLRNNIAQYLIEKAIMEDSGAQEAEKINSLLTTSTKKKNTNTNKKTKDVGAMSMDTDLWADLQAAIASQSKAAVANIPASSATEDSTCSVNLDAALRNDIIALTETDIVLGLSIAGGRAELLSLLQDGVEARRKLVACNLKLVTSIARSWMRRAISSSPIASTMQYTAVYKSGTWDLPALDDVIHEGVIGLTRAADKYEPKRGHKFSTYATHWITSYVRQCFRNASTGCLRVPAALHQIKADHARILKTRKDLDLPPPTMEEAAREIGVNVNRLQTALTTTQSLMSIDASMYSGTQNKKGSGAGGGDEGEGGLLLSDTLRCPEPKPEEFVELSILRQCLENAMAAELSPHERDVLRLRLGLDDGQSRTVREVVDVCGGSISMADVRSAERRAFKKLRAPNTVHAHNLMAFLDFADAELNMYSAGSVRGRR